MENTALLQTLQQAWGQITKGGNPRQMDIESELELYKKIFAFFQIGDAYFFLFNCVEQTIEYVHPSMEKITGYTLEQFQPGMLMESIHPADFPYFVQFEHEVNRFFGQLSIEDVAYYKVRYDYRLRKTDGSHIRVLQQALTIEHDPQTGGVLRTLVIHTDVTHLKASGEPSLSFIGLEGRPSFLNVVPNTSFKPNTHPFTKRETDILTLMVQGYTHQQIADMIFMSKLTVEMHYKNILHKVGCKNSTELLHTALMQGWI